MISNWKLSYQSSMKKKDDIHFPDEFGNGNKNEQNEI